MAQRSFFWDGASLGDAGALTVHDAAGIGYALANVNYESLLVDVAFRMLWNGDGNRGVLRGWGNELEVTGAATPVQVDTGGAVVYGMPYESPVAVNVAVPTPVNDTRHDRLVLRRDWTAQTVRITRLPGAEGGGLPALTQSPAPAGSGVYDVPLAALEVTTAGAIAVTDEREFCQFGTVPAAGTIGTTQIADDAVDWADRETRTCRFWLGGGDLHPMLSGGQFSPPGTVVLTGTPAWGPWGTLHGWQLEASRYEGVMGSFILPADHVVGDVDTFVWWKANAGIASTFYLRTSYFDYLSSQTSETINETLVVGDVYRTTGTVIRVSYPSDPRFYFVWWDNAAGAEDVSILGVEFVYTGYA